MRRFSQKNHLVTLNEINITPLLDLAFVLLIIFIITTPLLEKSINLNLPKGGGNTRPLEQKDIRTVEITADGRYALTKRAMTLPQIEQELAREKALNPNLTIYIRADELCRHRDVAAVFDALDRQGITRLAIRTQPDRR
jgi:biopolymer transport protein ExbD